MADSKGPPFYCYQFKAIIRIIHEIGSTEKMPSEVNFFNKKKILEKQRPFLFDFCNRHLINKKINKYLKQLVQQNI